MKATGGACRKTGDGFISVTVVRPSDRNWAPGGCSLREHWVAGRAPDEMRGLALATGNAESRFGMLARARLESEQRISAVHSAFGTGVEEQPAARTLTERSFPVVPAPLAVSGLSCSR